MIQSEWDSPGSRCANAEIRAPVIMPIRASSALTLVNRPVADGAAFRTSPLPPSNPEA
jgi:hypothetical protein